MVTLMNEGGFDLVTASGDASLASSPASKVRPIDTSTHPELVDQSMSASRMRPGSLSTATYGGAPISGAECADVQYQRRSGQESADEPERRLRGAGPRPDGKPNEGRVQAYDGPIHVADAATYLMAHKPEPSASRTPTSSTRSSTWRRLDLCGRAQRKLVGRYWHDAAVQIDDFKTEGVVASVVAAFQVDVRLLRPTSSRWPSTIPKKAPPWVGGHDDARAPTPPHPNCAYMWMEHSLSPKVQGDLAALVRLEPGRVRPPARATRC